MTTPFIPETCRPLMAAMDEAATCLDVIRDILLSINQEAGDPQQVRRRVAEAPDQQEAATRLLTLESEGGVA